MKKTLPVLVVVLLVTTSFVCVSQAQTPQKGSKNTITLTNGEVVWDLNGEWDTFVENYGPLAFAGKYPQITKITQTGSSFVAIRMIDDPYNLKGSQSLQGEIDKSGIKKVTITGACGMVVIKTKGQISDDGNKITIDDGVQLRLTLTRK
jgi:hypothetical protein